MAIRFRPQEAAARSKNVLLAVNTDGRIAHFHVDSGRVMHVMKEEAVEHYALSYSPSGERFAVGSKDCCIRVYDDSIKSCEVMLGGGGLSSCFKRFNRVFAIKFAPPSLQGGADNLVVSGGWDEMVRVWDCRDPSEPVRKIIGPHICGDSLDFLPSGEMLSGSWRDTDPLQLWDLGKGQLIQTVKWPGSIEGAAGASGASRSPCMLYAAKSTCHGHPECGDQPLIAAGGTLSNDAVIFRRSRPGAACPGGPVDLQAVARIPAQPGGIIALELGPTASPTAGHVRAAFASPDTVSLYDVPHSWI